MINGRDNITAESSVDPSEGSSVEVAYDFLLSKRGDPMPDHIL